MKESTIISFNRFSFRFTGVKKIDSSIKHYGYLALLSDGKSYFTDLNKNTISFNALCEIEMKMMLLE